MSTINNYQELVAQRKNAELRIATQKQLMRQGAADIKAKLEPFMYLLPFLSIFKKREKGNSLLKGAAAVGIDLFVGQNLLAKSNWFARLVVPMILKVLSSKVIGTTNHKKETVG